VNSHRLLIGCALFVLISACASVRIDLPAINESPTENYESGHVVWHDLLTTTPVETRRFYSELFGWTFERPGIDIGIGGDDSYMLIRHNGHLIGGVFDATQIGRNENVSQWITLFSTTEIEAAADRVVAEGGTVLTPPTILASRGTLAVFRDSSGAVFALVEPKGGNPAIIEPENNAFLWDEVWTDNVAISTGFYSKVLGYEHKDESLAESAAPYRVLSVNDKPRAGVLANPFEGEHPVWVNYIRVEDPAAIAARVEALGGRIIVEAQPRDIGGTVAFVAGPSGAGIALQTWPLKSEASE
jgi:predicted enzyme related to lactoylglutathione lyase